MPALFSFVGNAEGERPFQIDHNIRNGRNGRKQAAVVYFDDRDMVKELVSKAPPKD